MAGDWIKMRMDLQSHPKVVRILSATSSDKFRVIGGLHAVWSVFDQHSESGQLEGYTPEVMDHIIGWPGFARAMMDVGWLEYDGDETLSMPGFEQHNGQSAKRRAEEAERKKRARSERTNGGQNADKRPQSTVTREEKRREEGNPPKSPQGGKSGVPKYTEEFEEFWKLYPKKSGKGAAFKAWQRIKPDSDLRGRIKAAVEQQKKSEQWQRDNGAYIPNPATWLNQARWDDEPSSGGGASGGSKPPKLFPGLEQKHGDA